MLNTIVIVGENGVGKTTLLKSIYNAFKIDECTYKETGNGQVELTSSLYKVTTKLKDSESSVLHPHGRDYGIDIDKNYPKVVYVPTEINFDNTNKVDNNFNFKPSFKNVIDENITQNIPYFIATKITREIFRNRNKTIGEVIDKGCDEINNIFSVMDLDGKLIGISETNETKPIFRNRLGHEFDIDGLSSGEKQLFLRALSLKFLEINNSVILMDSPEIALYPQWQRKIIDVYEGIGENNQFIIATNSQYIIDNIELFQGSNVVLERPEVVISGFYKDFGYGFYCTNIEKQAKRLALTKRPKHIINKYIYSDNKELQILKFEHMTDE